MHTNSQEWWLMIYNTNFYTYTTCLLNSLYFLFLLVLIYWCICVWRRIKCTREEGIRFTITGSRIFISVLISNVAGKEDIVTVRVKGSRTGWLPMSRNWDQNWHVNALLQNQPLSFEVTSSDGITLTSYNVAPKDWSFGQSFEGKQFESWQI